MNQSLPRHMTLEDNKRRKLNARLTHLLCQKIIHWAVLYAKDEDIAKNAFQNLCLKIIHKVINTPKESLDVLLDELITEALLKAAVRNEIKRIWYSAWEKYRQQNPDKATDSAKDELEFDYAFDEYTHKFMSGDDLISPEEMEEEESLLDRIEKQLPKFCSEKEIQVFKMKRLGYSNEVIGENLSTSQGYVKQLFSRLTKRIRPMLKKIDIDIT